MRRVWAGCLVWMLSVFADSGVGAQGTAVDVHRLGPQVGEIASPFSGVDQFGRTQTLSSVMGPAGTMVVFFRSADW